MIARVATEPRPSTPLPGQLYAALRDKAQNPSAPFVERLRARRVAEEIECVCAELRESLDKLERARTARDQSRDGQREALASLPGGPLFDPERHTRTEATAVLMAKRFGVDPAAVWERLRSHAEKVELDGAVLERASY